LATDGGGAGHRGEEAHLLLADSHNRLLFNSTRRFAMNRQEDRKLPQNVPSAVKVAFDHVKRLYPLVTRVTFDGDGGWCYVDAAGCAPDFMGNVHAGILEAASKAQGSVPVTFGLNDDGVLTKRKLLEKQAFELDSCVSCQIG
jgi:branched-subunit amino acid aminotransferase/4-amino-4-deoxychorismate lyase